MGRAMSSLRKGGPPPRMKKRDSDPAVITNGTSNNTLYYRNDPPDDENMNEIADENVELTVLLPGGVEKETSVNSNIPMMDLLVNLAARNKLSPAGYMIVVLNESTNKPMDYKPNQTVGSLCPKSVDGAPRHMTVQLAPKKGEADKQKNVKNAQPFEMTKRFTVNLPQKQKKVLRISPAMPLEDVLKQICSERNLDPFRYKFQLPSDPYLNIELQTTVGELKSQEITMVAKGTVNSAMSMPNLASTNSTNNYMPSAGETKKKKGFFSFLKKDNSKKFSVQNIHHVEQPPPQRTAPVRSVSQEHAQIQNDRNPGARPKTMYAQSTTQLDKISEAKSSVPPLDFSSINNGPSGGAKSKSMSALKAESDKPVVQARKKRRAPAPPKAQSVQNTIQVEVNIENPTHSVKSKSDEVRQRTDNVPTKFHSRNSSDSSGYHELTLSGAESPEGPRIDEHLEGIDTASLDSGDHLNGDSGIQNISPPSARRIEGEIGSSQTLPLERSKKNVVSSSTPRSGSLDRLGKKKKAAPPPPGPLQPHASTSIMLTSSSEKKDDDMAINDVLNSLDQNLDDNDTSGEGAMLAETNSIQSEDLDHQNMPHPPRPCAFIAPPPPTEPPPDDSEPVDYNMLMSGRVDTVDVGVETSDDSTSYGPVSTRSSTESPVSKTPEYKNEMAQFVERMKEMTVDAEHLKKQAMDNEVNEDTQDTAVYIFPKEDENDSMEPTEIKEPKSNEEESESGHLSHSNREVSEITYDFKINAVPAEFQSEVVQTEEQEVTPRETIQPEEEVEEEEEEVIIETFEVIYPFSSNATTEQEVKVNEEPYQTPSQEKEPDIVQERKPEVVVEKEPDFVQEQVSVPEKVTVVETAPPPVIEKVKEPEKPKEKEQFVLTFDDLNKVDFSLMRKKKKMQPKERPVHASTPAKRHTVTSVDEIRSTNKDNVFITPTKEHNVLMDDGSIITEHGSVRGHKGEVKTKCSELSFSPNSEGEMENVLEEKSISMINLPVYKASVDSFDSPKIEKKDDVKVSKSEIVFSMKSSSEVRDNESVKRKMSTDSNLEKSVNDSGVEADNNSLDQQEILAAQYKQLQQQFVIWENQLEQNKKLLASTQIIPADDTSRQMQQQLQTQIQMQQQMMKQMQQSMEALSAQQMQQKSMEAQQMQQKSMEAQPDQSKENHVEQIVEKTEIQSIQAPPPAPALPNGKLSSNGEAVGALSNNSTEQPKQKSKNKPRKYIEPKLDPREELMIAIRNFGGRSAMKKVPVNKTHWHGGVP